MKSYRAIAEYYDAEYEHSPMLAKDIPFFLRQLPARKRLRVLDVCCGTGRSCIPIAQAGHRVVGVDVAPDMLAIATRKRDSVGLSSKQLQLLKMDAMKLDLDERFDWAAIFFNTFLNFVTLDQQDCVLQGLRKHLRKCGRIWIDIFQPNLEILARPESKNYDPSVFFVPSLDRTVQRVVDVKRDPSKQLQRVTFRYTWFDRYGVEQHDKLEFDLTFIFPRELQLVLERNGFRIEKIFGDYNGESLNVDSPRMIALARKE